MTPRSHRASGHAALGPALVDLGASPFPYEGEIPETGEPPPPFLGHDERGAFHLSPRGGRLDAERTYSDTRSLLYVPSRFDAAAPGAALLLFLHGNLATLARDVERRQRVPAQVEASRANVVLVAPQLAVDALDSSAGQFWRQGFLDDYLDKAAQGIETLSHGRIPAASVDRLPVIVVAYSGGYLPAAFTLRYELGRSDSRIAGVVLLDALFGEEPKFESWILASHERAFFVSAYSKSSAPLDATLQSALADKNIPFQTTLPAEIVRGDVVFVKAPEAIHNDFVTRAWRPDPLSDLLARIRIVGSR